MGDIIEVFTRVPSRYKEHKIVTGPTKGWSDREV